MVIKGKLGEIVGQGNVFDSREVIEGYCRDHSLERPGLFTCVVRPKTVAETQKIIQLANEARFAVVPQTSGIHFNGSAVPKEGGVVLDLSQMNRIVEIVEDPRVAYLKVGVTWEQLCVTLDNQGYTPIIPLLPHASRSVIMDYLEREQPVIQNHESAEPLLSMQVIWGNGELFVTGSASAGNFRSGSLADGVCPTGPGCMSWDTFLYGAQGTIGVVTWGVVEFEYKPEASRAFFISSDTLGELIEPAYRILRAGICNECLLINDTNLATILTEKWPEQFHTLKANLSPWILIIVQSAPNYRPEEKMHYQEDALKNIMLSSFRQLDLMDTLPVMLGAENKIPNMLRSHWPANKTYWKHAYKGACQDITFITTLDRVENYLPVIFLVASKYGYPISNIGSYIQPLQDGHACQAQFNFYYDPDDKTEKEVIKAIYLDAAAALIEEKAYFNRPYPLISNVVYRKNGEYAALLKRFKKYFDPNSIMNPGNLCF
jgi:hypothetical protein